jgi:hypothetical protein
MEKIVFNSAVFIMIDEKVSRIVENEVKQDAAAITIIKLISE